jgi:hypothetical protein
MTMQHIHFNTCKFPVSIICSPVWENMALMFCDHNSFLIKITAMNDEPTKNVKFRKLCESEYKQWKNLSVSMSSDTTMERGEIKSPTLI